MNRKSFFAVAAAIIAVVLIWGCVSNKSTTPDQPPPPTDQVSNICRTTWIQSSRPATIDQSLQFGRGRMGWYNPVEPIPASDIWGTDIPAGQPDMANVLNVLFSPIDHLRLIDTINNVIDTSILIPPELSWGGITACLPRTTARAFIDAAYLDIRLRGDVGIMHIDLGRISEDIDDDGRLDSEDKDFNGILDDVEDVGLDGLPDFMETGYDPVTMPDPSGDNWIYDPDNIDPWHVNGTEGNHDDPDGGYYPDTEDRNFNGLELENSYFSYRIDLSDNSSHYVPQSRNEYGWKTIRLPVGEPGVSDAATGNPSWNEINFFRIWFDSLPASYIDDPLMVQLASMTLDIEFDSVTPPPTLYTFIVKDVDYKKRTAFDLGRLPLIRSRSDTLPEPDKYDFLPGDKILKAILYLDNKSADADEQAAKTPAICYIDPTDTLSDDTLSVYRYEGYFDAVDEANYYLYPEYWFFLFTRAVVSSNYVLAVYMEVQRVSGTVDTIGNISTTPFRLKLIKPEHYLNDNHHVWEYQWKNIYYMGRQNFDVRQTDVTIYKGSPINNQTPNPDDLDHQDGIPYLQILGLDQGDNNALGPPDGQIDRQANLIDPQLGLLFFPTRHPFDSRFGFAIDYDNDTIYLQDSVPDIYLNPSLQQISKYYIEFDILFGN